MKYPAILSAQALIYIFKQKQIQHIVISPGSRNAPLTLGFNLDHFFKTYSVVDERCAAFFGLGLSQQNQQPAVLVCTSGSALLNYYPAIAEAFYQQIPLIVLSADRPASKIDIGDGQTIRQNNVFSNHSHFNANLDVVDCKENHHKICLAIEAAISQKGPVHINIPFEEPLYDLTSVQTVIPKISSFTCNRYELKSSYLDQNIWENAKKKLILIGQMNPNTISDSVLEFLASEPSIVVLTESTSNVQHPSFLNKIDVLITPFSELDFENFKPDLLVTFGGMIVSKRIKSFLRKYQPEHHWHIDAFRAYNTFGCLTNHFKTEVDTFFDVFKFFKSSESSYKTNFLAINQHRKNRHSNFMEKVVFSDMKVYDMIINKLDVESNLQISNSSPIRYMQLFDLKQNQIMFCNRGTSGIDGSTSTSLGAAVASKKQTILITGDLSFFYDSNALWNNYTPKNFKIIIINNQGGGIFRILPGFENNDIFNNFFETKHELSAQDLAKMFKYHYFNANDETSLAAVLDVFFNKNEPSILEVFTPSNVNDVVLKSYFDFLKVEI